MNLREVRQAATRLHNGWHSQSPKLLGDYETVCDFVLATIDPEPDAAITSDWLREVWGLKEEFNSEAADYVYYDEHGCEFAKFCQYGYVWVMEQPEWPHDLHTRQQFCDIARALGIQRKDGK